jgi:hypothetical protein
MVLRPASKTIRQRVYAVLINLAFPAAFLLGIPIIANHVMERGMTWELAFFIMPDMITWLFIGIAVHLISAAIHLSFIIKYYLRVRFQNEII